MSLRCVREIQQWWSRWHGTRTLFHHLIGIGENLKTVLMHSELGRNTGNFSIVNEIDCLMPTGLPSTKCLL